mgnify:CR=1 FL=1
MAREDINGISVPIPDTGEPPDFVGDLRRIASDLAAAVDARTPQVVNHGSDNTVPRPNTVGMVVWKGSVTPLAFGAIDVLFLTDSEAPNTPTSLIVTTGDASIDIAWTDPTNEDLAGVRVYIDDALVDTVAPGVGAYQAQGLTNNQAYTLYLRAEDTFGNVGDPTTSVSARPGVLPIATAPLVHYRADALAVTDGGAISTWDDLSANAYDLTPMVGSETPLYQRAVLGLMPGVKFDAFTGNGTRLEADLADVTTACSVFVVFKSAQVNAFQFLATDSTDTDPSFAINRRVTPSELWMGTNGGSANWINPMGTFTQDAVEIVEIHAGAGGTTGLVNGVAASAYGANMAAKTALKFALMRLGGSRSGTAGTFDGHYGEVLVFPSELSSGDKTAVRTYLADRYGVTLP